MNKGQKTMSCVHGVNQIYRKILGSKSFARWLISLVLVPEIALELALALEIEIEIEIAQQIALALGS